METIEKFVNDLNKLVNTYQLNAKKDLKPLLFSIKDFFSIEYQFVDFESYNQEWLEILSNEKIHFIKEQRFKVARNFRELEKECIRMIELRNKYGIVKSTFYFEHGCLFYFCCGNTYIDISVNKYIEELNECQH